MEATCEYICIHCLQCSDTIHFPMNEKPSQRKLPSFHPLLNESVFLLCCKIFRFTSKVFFLRQHGCFVFFRFLIICTKSLTASLESFVSNPLKSIVLSNTSWQTSKYCIPLLYLASLSTNAKLHSCI